MDLIAHGDQMDHDRNKRHEQRRGNEGPSQMLCAPANDPFVITVGAVGTGDTPAAADDTAAPWSSYGYTGDGYIHVVTSDEAVLVDPDQPAALAAAIAAVRRDPDMARVRAERALDRLLTAYSVGPWVARYDNVYNNILNSHGRIAA